MKSYLIGAGLFCGGLLFGVLASRKYYKDYYQKIADEEIASVKRKYSSDKEAAVAAVNKELDQYKADRRVMAANLREAYRELGVAQADDIMATQGYVIKDEATLDMVPKKKDKDDKITDEEYMRYYLARAKEDEDLKNALARTGVDPESVNVFDVFRKGHDHPSEDDSYVDDGGALLTGDELETQQIKNLNSRSKDRPRIEIITADTFGDLYTEGYDTQTLMYYVLDHTLACEESDMDGRPEIVDDRYALVGDALSDFYDDLRPEEPIYVRNNALSVDYEIIKVCASYAESEGDFSIDVD